MQRRKSFQGSGRPWRSSKGEKEGVWPSGIRPKAWEDPVGVGNPIGTQGAGSGAWGILGVGEALWGAGQVDVYHQEASHTPLNNPHIHFTFYWRMQGWEGN